MDHIYVGVQGELKICLDDSFMLQRVEARKNNNYRFSSDGDMFKYFEEEECITEDIYFKRKECSAPEIFGIHPKFNSLVDYYSVGAIIYQLLTGNSILDLLSEFLESSEER